MRLFFLFSLIPFYILGSFPTGMLLARLHGVDITTTGSKNVGATNVSRVLGIKSGIITLLVDTFKGVLAVLLSWFIISDSSYITAGPYHAAGAGVAVVCGHCFSIPGLWRGGKGVATALGVLIALDPISALFALTVFTTLLIWRSIVSLASVSAVISAPIFSALRNINDYHLAGLAIIAIIVVARHHANLSRLVLGTEKKFELNKVRLPEAKKESSTN